MKRLISLALVVLLTAPTVLIGQTDGPVLRNADVLEMLRVKVPLVVILATISRSKCNFDTLPPVLADLKTRGVPDDVLIAMVNAADKSLKNTESVTPPPFVLRDGTEFNVVTVDEITSKTAAEGDPISFRVDEDVKVDGHLAIRAGTLVKGEVSAVSKSGRLGKAGQLSIRVTSTKSVDGQRVRLRASKGKSGDDKTGTTVTLVVLFGVLGFLKKGSNAKIKPGTRIRVFVDDDVSITPQTSR